MSFISHCNTLLSDPGLYIALSPIALSEITAVIDLTLLDKSASAEALLNLHKNALQYQVAAVCVYPEHLPVFCPSLIKKATVINFPEGTDLIDKSLKDIDAVSEHVDEIDYLFPYPSYLNGNAKIALEACQAIIDHCKQYDLTTKIILETGAFNSLEAVYQLSKEIILQGCDFLKTSTGKLEQGATLSAVFAMLSAIQDSNKPCGIKISGGIKTIPEALKYFHLAQKILDKTSIDPSWIRIGSSSLLKDLINLMQ